MMRRASDPKFQHPMPARTPITGRATMRIENRVSGWRRILPRLLSPILTAAVGIAGVSGMLPIPGGIDARPAKATQSEERPITERDRVTSQMANVKRLLESSSGAKTIQSGSNELAKKIHADAQQRFHDAEAAFEADELATARRLLIEASKSMFQAVRMMGPAPGTKDTVRADFSAREASVRALVDALKRIADAEGDAEAMAGTITSVTRAVDGAQELRAQGRESEAWAMLNAGYETVKAAVESIRDGKTLVRSLTFENDEAEYRYELNRNDSHQMLVQVLTQDKNTAGTAKDAIDGFVKRAGELRQRAERESRDGDFRTAIGSLEASTKELLRAVRSAGVFIPE